MGIQQKFLGYEADKLLFDLEGVLTNGQAGTIGDAEDVGVHREGGFTKGRVQDDIGGLTPHPGQGLEGDSILGDLATMVLLQQSTGLDDVCSLGVEEAQGADVFLETFFPQCQQGRGGVGDGEEAGGGLVDPFVGGLGGEDDSHQQFEGAGIVEFRPRGRIGGAESFEDQTAFYLVHGAGRIGR